MKLAFLDLPDDRVDLISKARHDPNIEIVLVAHPDPNALALKIAEVLQIPHSTEPLDLLALKPDRVALPSLASPSAAALARAGISERIFVTLEGLAQSWPTETAPSPAEEPNPIELWESQYDDATGGSRLSRIRAALAISDDRQLLFREVLALAVERSGGDAGSIMVVDEEAGELRIAFADGLSTEIVRGSRQKLGEGVAGKVALDGKPLIINERLSDPRFRDSRDRARIAAAMCAPIKVDGRTIGVLNVSRDRPAAPFESDDLSRLAEIADQISEILQRAIRVARREQDAIELRARREIEIAFGRKGLERNERLRLAGGRLAELLGADAVQVHLVDESLDRFRTISSAGRYGEEGELPLHQGLLARVLAEQRTLFLTARPARPSSPSDELLPNLVVTPLIASRPIGVLVFECVGEAASNPQEFERLAARVAGYVARSIEERDDESELSRRSALLGSLSDIAARIMISRDMESLLSEVVGALQSLFPSNLLTARIRGDGGGFLFRSAFEGREQERQRALELESTLARRAVESKRELTSSGISPQELRQMIEEHGVCGYAFIPIRADEEIAGILGVMRPGARRGSEPAAGLSRLDIQTLRKLALYVSIAVENVRRGAGRAEPRVQDPVTGLLGSAGFEARVQDEVKRAERYRERFVLTLCAIQDYERLVEQLGPAWTDGFLKEFAHALRRNVREVDAVARIMDGRFAVLSPASEKDSGALLKRLDSLVDELSSIKSIPRFGEVRLVGRQYSFPDEIGTGGELLSLVRAGA